MKVRINTRNLNADENKYLVHLLESLKVQVPEVSYDLHSSEAVVDGISHTRFNREFGALRERVDSKIKTDMLTAMYDPKMRNAAIESYMIANIWRSVRFN